MNNDGTNLSHVKICKSLFKERLDGIAELNNETNFYDLIYCFR